MERKPEVLLERWCFHDDRLYGQFFRHRVIGDGTFAHTSRVLEVDLKHGIAETENTLYTLGKREMRGCHWGCRPNQEP